MVQVPRSKLQDCARDVLNRVSAQGNTQGAFVVYLRGELGAGKTTFMQALAKALGIEETVQSPTFVLMKTYPVAFKNYTRLVHIDAYRLESPEEFAALRPEEFLNDPHALVCIEWPERVEYKLPAPDLTLWFSVQNDPDARDITIR